MRRQWERLWRRLILHLWVAGAEAHGFCRVLNYWWVGGLALAAYSRCALSAKA